jgi:hypothetical protein
MHTIQDSGFTPIIYSSFTVHYVRAHVCESEGGRILVRSISLVHLLKWISLIHHLNWVYLII